MLDILVEAFSNPISERDYRDIVEALREYSSHRDNRAVELLELTRSGYPKTYHPCDHMENIRFALCFGEEDNRRVRVGLDVLKKWKRG